MRHPLYLAYSLILLGLTGAAEWRGWSMTSVNQLKNVPRTVRDNPGSYRSHYGFYPRYFGGK
jgi:hypothetical protein